MLAQFSIIIETLAYCYFGYIKVKKYQETLFLYLSTVEKRNLDWLKKITICVFFIAVSWLCNAFFQISVKSIIFDTIITCAYFLGIYFIAYYAIKQNEIYPYSENEKKEIEDIIEVHEVAVEAKRKLVSDDQLEGYKLQLMEFMVKEKPYLDFEISLIKLSSLFKVSPHLLSYIINNGFGENFFQFINRYRVEEAKHMILNPNMKHLTFIGIALEVGFNSKTVFNTTFKKITGKTPSEFKRGLTD
jgi:AraC-like DNA-binding protein